METQLKAARVARGWSQLHVIVELERIAAARGIAVPGRDSLKTAISRWENGHVSPKEPYVGLFAELYGVAPAELGLSVAAALPFVPAPRRGGSLGPSRLTPESVAFMDELLAHYTQADNALGPRHLLHVASQHLVHFEPLLVGARGPLREEALRLASRFAEFAGWLSQDAGDLAGAQHWTDRALDFVEESADPAGRAYVLMRKSAIAADRQEHGRAVSLAAAACRDAPRLPPRVRALALRQRAIAQALVREERESDRAADQALEAITGAGESGEFAYCTPAFLTMESGVSAFHLRQYDVAAARLSSAAATWPAGFARDQGLCLARLAVTEAARGNPDLACAVGQDALAVARVAESARTRAALISLRNRLAPYDRVALVSEFRRELEALR